MNGHDFFEVLGHQLGGRSQEEIAIAAVLDDMTAEWEDLEQYLADITQQQAMEHVPLATRNVVKKPTLPDVMPWFAASKAACRG